MRAEPTPSPEPDVELRITISRAGDRWQARVERAGVPDPRVFHSVDDLAAYLRRCRPLGLL